MQAQAGGPWSPQQRYWLQALGCNVMRVVGDEEPLAEPAAPVDEPARPERMQVRQGSPVERDVAPPAPRRAPPVSPEPRVAEPAAAPAAQPRHGAMRRPAALPDRLQLAVLRASGLPPTDPRVQALLAEWPSEMLRADPSAKRRLWPLLRALRRPA